MAVTQATKIIHWQENLPSEEIPPDWMWTFDEELNDWFIDVKAARDAKYGLTSSGDTEAPMTGNEMLRRR